MVELAIEKKTYFRYTNEDYRPIPCSETEFNAIKQMETKISVWIAHQNTNKRASKNIGPYLSLKQAFEYIHPGVDY